MTVIVSAYFKIPSKQPHEVYIRYIRNFFASVSVDVVFFTSADILTDLGSIPKNVTICLTSLASLEDFGMDFWTRQSSRDTERYHTPQLGIIWYAKKTCVLRAMRLRPSESVFIWCDAGCIRDDACLSAASQFGRRTNINLNDGSLHVQELIDQEIDLTKMFHTFPERWIAGAIIAGNRQAWTHYKTIYDAMLDEYDDAGVSACSDQYVTASCIQRHPAFFTLHSEHVSVNDWFKFLELL